MDAHHIMERRLFRAPNELGGYFLNNGASVCERCHLYCEQTIYTTEEVRAAASITQVILPQHLYSDQRYDKWGNPLLDNGMRLRGELFYDPSVQKVLSQGGMMRWFHKYTKYPRTHHLPWSPGKTDDDRLMPNWDAFLEGEIVITEKMDGENTTLYSDYVHARSIDFARHPSRSWVQNFHARIRHDIPDGWRICGENLYAEHSLHYDQLESFLYGFGVWNDQNVALCWEETVVWLSLLTIPVVPVLYRGVYYAGLFREIENRLDFNRHEGYVVRVAREFRHGEFPFVVGKFVRPQHVQTQRHWFFGGHMTQNSLKDT